MVLNDQVQTGPVTAENEVIVAEATSGLAAGTTAVGNSIGAVAQNQNLTFQSSQVLSGSVTADAFVQTQGTSGPAHISSTSATGNTGDAAACCGYLSGDVHQRVDGHTAVHAKNVSKAGGAVEHASGSASAVGNTQGYSAVNGTVGARTVQQHYGTTNADNQAVFCCVTGSGAFAATAVANNVTSHVENGESLHEVSQTVDGHETRATNDVYVVTGNEITGVATATANNAHIYNTGGYSELVAEQTNQSLVEAEALTSIDTWYGTGSAISYGVGNSIYLANVSPDPVMRTEQLNNGDVNSYATFTGGAGEGDAYTSATAVGNAVSGYACNSCYGVIDATNHQVNNGAVRAVARTLTAGHGHAITSMASAVGNTATYESVGNGN